ncbi:MAG: DUF4381 domain-containing protein [Parahaliea sp.]
MIPPALPEHFGNYALGEHFVEVVSPPPVDWWPQTVGWHLVFALLALWLARRSYRALRHWYHNRYRREALKALANLSPQVSTTQLAAQASNLLKRTALAVFPRAQVAALTGSVWVNFLNDCCQQPPFNNAQAELLTAGQYRMTVLSQREAEQLLDACGNWIRHHRGPQDA